MNYVEIAISYGFYVKNDGSIYNKINEKISIYFKDNKYPMFYFKILDKRYKVYVSRMQSYKKFGEIAFKENAAFINGNTLDCSYDNISLQSIELGKRRDRKTKICTKCNKEFPIDFFKIKNKNTGLRVPECHECNKESKRECYKKYYDYNKEKFLSRNKEFRKDRMVYLNDKKSTGCIICKEKDIGCLDFHHLGDKKYNISSIFTSLSIKEIEEEIQKCVILCANCHRKLHYYNLTIDELKEKHTKK